MHLYDFFSLLLQSEIGFGKMETYIKLEKLGEVCVSFFFKRSWFLWLAFLMYNVFCIGVFFLQPPNLPIKISL